MAQINLPSITGTRTAANVVNNDRMIIWPDSVSATADLRYITFADIRSNVISAASATYVSQTIIDAKGDLLVGSANDALSKLTVGTNSNVLIANSDAGNGLGVNWGQVATDGISDYAVNYN